MLRRSLLQSTSLQTKRGNSKANSHKSLLKSLFLPIHLNTVWPGCCPIFLTIPVFALFLLLFALAKKPTSSKRAKNSSRSKKGALLELGRRRKNGFVTRSLHGSALISVCSPPTARQQRSCFPQFFNAILFLRGQKMMAKSVDLLG